MLGTARTGSASSSAMRQAVLMRIFRLLWRYPAITVAVVVLATVIALHAGDAQAAGRWVATAFVGAFIVWTLVGMVRDVLRGHIGLDVRSEERRVGKECVGTG